MGKVLNSGDEGRGVEPDKKASNLQRVSVGDLEVGMHIVELDRPWLETPFLLQGFELSDEDELRTLKKYCRYVYIHSSPIIADRGSGELTVKRSASKQIRETDKGSMLNHSGRTKEPRKRRVVHSRPAYDASLSIRKEYLVAGPAYRKGKSDIKKILRSAQVGQIIDTEAAEVIVSSCVESMLRSSDAMIWMSKIKHESEYTAEHCLNVCILAIAFGRHLGFDATDLQMLGLCGLLHDVGKMQTPKAILEKRGSLTDEEFNIMRQHTTDGHTLLSQSETLSALPIDVALNHHERPDGKGYPRGLVEGEISEYARVIAIVDAYDAMTSDRCYSRGMSPVDAQKQIYKYSGTQFDKKYSLAFIQAIGPYPPGTIVELHNGMVGIALTGQRKFRHLPTVILLRDSEKNVIDEKVVDLCLTDSEQLDSSFLIRRSLRDGTFGIKLEGYKLMLEGDAGSTMES